MTQLTVGIPVFNAMPYLRESMESVLHQTYSDFAILAINDGSTDASLDYLNSIRDPRLRVVKQSNRGLTATLNRMLDEAETPWLVRFDADDVAYPDRLARTIEHAKRYPDAGMFYSMADYYPAGSIGKFRSTKGSPKQIAELVRSGYLPSICHPTVTLNVDKTKNVGGYRFDLHVEDIDLWWRMALRYDIRMIPDVTLGFRQNCNSVSSANLETQALNTLYVQYLLLSHLWNLEPLTCEEARKPLSALFNRQRLTFKAHLRAFNMELGRGHKRKACAEASLAFFSSPRDFTGRLLDEVITGRAIGLGESPAYFKAHVKQLWPKHPRLNREPLLSYAPTRDVSGAIQSEPIRQSNKLCAPSQGTAPTFPAYELGGISVHVMTKFDLVNVATEAIEKGAQYLIANHNLHGLYCWFHDPKVRKFHESADYTHIDGMSLILLGWVLGLPLKREHRTGYVDLLPLLAQKAVESGWRIFYLGSKPGVAERAAIRLRWQYSGLEIRTRHGHFDPNRIGEDNQETLADIKTYAPHILLVGMGMPRQEAWILENRDRISANAVFCCGALMDYVAGEIPTPPRWIGMLGFEWLIRLASEPSRLWRRYLVEPWSVFGNIAVHYLKYGTKNQSGGDRQ